MRHIVQFSGGAASAYVAWLVVNEFGKENTILLFHNTKAEHPDADRFRKQVSEFVGVPITEVSDGRDLWAGKGHFYKVWRHYPERFERAKQMEELVGHTVFKDKSLSELEAEWIASGEQLELDFGEEGVPCMCAV